MKEKIVEMLTPEVKQQIDDEMRQLKYTKNFRSASAEEWYVFLPSYQDPQTQGAAGKAIIHYDLYGNKEIFIHTTIIFDDPKLHQPESYPIVYSIADELVNRLVGYADTLLSVHSGANSFQAEYVNG
ncbi:hypothetical protein [Ammoniphilus sp. CFH 90114]|uniref:hypothetical protein n=1 Tax=Ammoniphilus sp. CFH 90114 TaxID=2493665 RepID=UPI00100FBEF0|nr:hypothetical protein [Ammoniphilus sp. CFH 90114]RXT08072.1 hypothetical protein EIZ39_11725 [Ammoniphilus sp. CFH 90114]